MPSWRLHEKWAAKAGIDPYVARQVDRLIDRDLGYHDIGRRRVSDCWSVLYSVVLPIYLYEGARAFFLHHALDRLAYIVRRRIMRAKEAGQPYARVDTTVLKEIEELIWRLIPTGQPTLSKRGRIGFSRFFTTGRAAPKWPELGWHPRFDPYLISCAERVLEFLYAHFSDIVHDIAEEIKSKLRP